MVDLPTVQIYKLFLQIPQRLKGSSGTEVLMADLLGVDGKSAIFGRHQAESKMSGVTLSTADKRTVMQPQNLFLDQLDQIIDALVIPPRFNSSLLSISVILAI